RRPEGGGIRHRPAPQVLVAVVTQAAAGLQPGHEAGHAGAADRLVVWLPQHRAVAPAGQVTLAGFHALSIVPSRRGWQRPGGAVVAQIMRFRIYEGSVMRATRAHTAAVSVRSGSTASAPASRSSAAVAPPLAPAS